MVEPNDTLANLRNMAQTNYIEALEALDVAVQVWQLRDRDTESEHSVKNISTLVGHATEIRDLVGKLAAEEVTA